MHMCVSSTFDNCCLQSCFHVPAAIGVHEGYEIVPFKDGIVEQSLF
jgi:hypothetical protein